MFNNLVNRHDLCRALRKLTPWGIARIIGTVLRLARGRKARVRDAWSRGEPPPRNWWDIPEVRERWNRMIAGDAAADWRASVARKHLREGGPARAVSICCGAGGREIAWAGLGVFECIDGYDISPTRIELARARARERGLEETVRFHVGDALDIDKVDKADRPEGPCDVVLAESALHHLSPLEDALAGIERVLRPGGLLIVNDFVGPTRFQWTRDQLAVADRLIAGLPEKYRIRWSTGRPKLRAERPSRLAMYLRDPSEAVESSRVMPLLRRRFDIVEEKGYGGNVLALVFEDIAHHFRSGDEETRALIKTCFEAEDEFLARDGVTSDHVVAVCRRSV